MTTRGWYLIGMLVLLFLANLAMLMGMTNWPVRFEGFAAHMDKPTNGKFSGVAKEHFADVEAAVNGKKHAGSGVSGAGLEPFADLAAGSGNLAAKVAPINMPPVLGQGSVPPPVPG